MELYLKKYFWVVHVLVLSICAVLLARGCNHIVEAKYLIGVPAAAGAAAARHKPVGTRPARPTTASSLPPKDTQVVIDRNLFCSSCEPARPVDVGPVAGGDPNRPPTTALPLLLMATSVASDEAMSSATVANTQLNKQGSYWLNEDIPGAGTIVRIQPRFVDFRNSSANRVERLDLAGTAPPPPPAAAPPVATAPPPGATDDFMASVDKGVRKLDDTHYEIDRSLVDKVLGDPNLVARAARIVPSIKDGKSNGFKLYAIRPNSVYAKIGLQNGDTIHSINGFEMTSPDKALEVYTKVKSASNLSITMTRRGQPVTMEYGIK